MNKSERSSETFLPNRVGPIQTALNCDDVYGSDRLIEIAEAIITVGYDGLRLVTQGAELRPDGKLILAFEYDDQTPEGRLISFLYKLALQGKSLQSFTVEASLDGLKRAYFALNLDSPAFTGGRSS